MNAVKRQLFILFTKNKNSRSQNYIIYNHVHSKRCNVRLTYVIHVLNVYYKMYVKRIDQVL